MSAIAAIAINDGQGTPVEHTFNPLAHSGDNFEFRETGTSSVLAAGLVVVSSLKVKGNASLEKFRIKIIIPALETATGQNSDGYTAAPKLAYSLMSIHDFVIPKRATLAQRKDLVAYAKNILGVTLVTDLLWTSERPY